MGSVPQLFSNMEGAKRLYRGWVIYSWQGYIRMVRRSIALTSGIYGIASKPQKPSSIYLVWYCLLSIILTLAQEPRTMMFIFCCISTERYLIKHSSQLGCGSGYLSFSLAIFIASIIMSFVIL